MKRVSRWPAGSDVNWSPIGHRNSARSFFPLHWRCRQQFCTWPMQRWQVRPGRCIYLERPCLACMLHWSLPKWTLLWGHFDVLHTPMAYGLCKDIMQWFAILQQSTFNCACWGLQLASYLWVSWPFAAGCFWLSFPSGWIQVTWPLSALADFWFSDFTQATRSLLWFCWLATSCLLVHPCYSGLRSAWSSWKAYWVAASLWPPISSPGKRELPLSLISWWMRACNPCSL